MGTREGFSEHTDDILDAFFDVENEEPTSMPFGEEDALGVRDVCSQRG